MHARSLSLYERSLSLRERVPRRTCERISGRGKTRKPVRENQRLSTSFSSVPKFVHMFEAAGEGSNRPSSGPSGHLLPKGEGLAAGHDSICRSNYTLLPTREQSRPKSVCLWAYRFPNFQSGGLH